jgi:hypothetical protein
MSYKKFIKPVLGSTICEPLGIMVVAKNRCMEGMIFRCIRGFILALLSGIFWAGYSDGRDSAVEQLVIADPPAAVATKIRTIITKQRADIYAFRTPLLLNVAMIAVL